MTNPYLRQIRVYIAAPLTSGDQQLNCKRARLLTGLLLSYGFAVYCPHQMGRDIEDSIDYDQWMTQDFSWVAVSDVLFRMPGESPGADDEVDYANVHEIEVVYSLSALLGFRERCLIHAERTEHGKAKAGILNNNRPRSNVLDKS